MLNTTGPCNFNGESGIQKFSKSLLSTGPEHIEISFEKLEGNRPPGRPKHKFEDNGEMDFKETE